MVISSYNRELYEVVKSKIEQGYHRIFYSEATGLGKSIIMQMLISEVFKGQNILYIAPKYSIWNNISQYENMAGVDCCMYAAFGGKEITENIIARYEVIFIDECHHMYSDVFGANIQRMMCKYDSKYFIGFTATPKLKGRMANEAFETSCFGLDMYDAVQQGIFPKLKYAILVPERDGHIFDEDILIQVQQILADNDSKDLKCLLYFTNVQELSVFMNIMSDYFEQYRMMCIHSRQSKQENKKVLTAFNSCQGKAMLLSVDSLLEGVHLNGVNCVVLFRHTQSLNVFLQITGRLCKPYSTEEPLFIDVADSISGINFDIDSVSGSDGQGVCVLHSLRDIIDVHCEEYKYVEFYNRLRERDAKIYTYKDFTWCNHNQLGKQLGVSGSAITSWLQRNAGSTEEDYIDFKLKQKMLYREVDCRSVESVAAALHKSRHDVQVVMGLNKFTKQDYVDFVLKDRTLTQYTESLQITYYRGVDCYDELSIARSLMLDVKQVHKGVKQAGGFMAYVDCVLQGDALDEYIKRKTVTKRFCYKGIRYNNEVDICEQIGVTIKTYRTFMRKSGAKTPRVFIDAYIPHK